MYSFPNLDPVCCSMSSSNCCFLTCIQISQEAGLVVWYFHLFQNFPVYCDSHRGDYSNELFLPAAPPRPLRPEARPPHAPKLLLTLPLSPRVIGFAQHSAPLRLGSAESPPQGRSALSLRVRAASHKHGSGARGVEVSQLSVSFFLSNRT